LRKDIAAVRAALNLLWTTSPVEGQINRLKMIKRTMYGRAGFELLRARTFQRHDPQSPARELRVNQYSPGVYSQIALSAISRC
jgi:hypothetical protein